MFFDEISCLKNYDNLLNSANEEYVGKMLM